MKAPRSVGWRISVPWLALAALAAVILAARLQLGFDLSAFFPRDTSLMHDVLLEQLRNGPGSRLVVIGIAGLPPEQLDEPSGRMRRALERTAYFTTVQNGQSPTVGSGIPEPIASYYLLLQDVDYSRASLHAALHSRLQDLALGGGDVLLDLIARDPFLITMDVLERLAPADPGSDIWIAENGSAVLVAQTRAPATDLVAQAEAMAAVRSAFAELRFAPALDLEITGVGAFGVELQGIIRSEARSLSVLAVAALCLVLLLIYRSVPLLLLSTLPMGMGCLLGLAAVSLAFNNVHGITLAFGFTLLGITVDYPMHLFSHVRQSGRSAIDGIWPTMRLGALSTAVAYLAITLSGSDGLTQLGVFTVTGVIAAALVTRFWLPALLPAQSREIGISTALRSSTVSIIPAVVMLLAALMTWRYLPGEGLWDDRLSSLSPVPEERLRTDMTLRAAAGTPDMRYQLVMHDDSLDDLLVRGEEIEQRLTQAAGDGLLENWWSVSQVLPSRRLQAARRDAIPAAETLRSRVSDVVSQTPFNPAAFDPFLAAAESAARLPPLEPSAMAGTPFEPWLDSHLLRVGDRWVSLISVSAPDAAGLSQRVKSWGADIELVDLQQSTVALMRAYRSDVISTVSAAAMIIVLLIYVQRRRLVQVLWLSFTVAAALAATLAIAWSFHGQLTVIHLVAALLVLGLGLDYALFLSRTETDAERRATDQAVLACAASTTLAFGILATSSIPLLKFIGFTVAVGSATSYLLALAGSRRRRRARAAADSAPVEPG